MKRTIHAQIEEIEHQIRQARADYPSMVTRRRIRQAEADEHLLRLECALDTLKWVQKNEVAIRVTIGGK